MNIKRELIIATRNKGKFAKIAIGIIAVVSFFAFTPIIYACDSLGCMLMGKEQEILAVVIVTEEQADHAVVIARKYFEQSKIFPSGPISIVSTPGRGILSWEDLGFKKDKQYLVSLSCEDESRCFVRWGRWEVTGSSPSIWKLKKITNGDDSAVQWFLDSKGEDFYFIENRAYAVASSGDCYQIYPVYERVDCEKENTENTRYPKDRLLFAGIFFGGLAVVMCIWYAIKIRRKNV